MKKKKYYGKKQICCTPTVWHHIVPEYRGGKTVPENMIELTYKEHATAHFLLWLQYHDDRDWLAWRGYEGLIGKEQIALEAALIGSKKSVALGKGIHTKDKALKSKWGKMGAAAAYEKHKETIIATLRENARRGAELGLGGHEPGKWIWITNGQESKKVLKVEQLPDGWRRGRHSRKAA